MLAHRILLRVIAYTGFQWGLSQVIEQQDIQEFCRVLITTLEAASGSSEITKVFEGITTNYVHCMECEHESVRLDSFLDITIPLQDFATQVKCLLEKNRIT